MNRKIICFSIILASLIISIGYALAQSTIQSNIIHVSIPYKLTLNYGIYTAGQVQLQAHLSLNDAPIKNALIHFYVCNSYGSNLTRIGAYSTDFNGLACMNYYTTEKDLYFTALWTIGD
jgi:hypothetical protein